MLDTTKNWCQIGVKIEKITILKEIRYCKPLILKGLQKNIKNISTHLLLLLLISFVFTALGVTLTIKANLVPVAPDGLVQALSQKYNVPFGKIKIYFDLIVVILSCSLMLCVKGGIEGIGIGTILSVFTVGKMISYFAKEEVLDKNEAIYKSKKLLRRYKIL